MRVIESKKGGIEEPQVAAVDELSLFLLGIFRSPLFFACNFGFGNLNKVHLFSLQLYSLVAYQYMLKLVL